MFAKIIKLYWRLMFTEIIKRMIGTDMAVVTKDVPKGAIVGGNPGKILKYRDLEKYDMLKKQDKIYLREKIKTNLKMVVKNYESNI